MGQERGIMGREQGYNGKGTGDDEEEIGNDEKGKIYSGTLKEGRWEGEVRNHVQKYKIPPKWPNCFERIFITIFYKGP